MVVLEAGRVVEQVAEELAQVVVVRRLVEAQLLAVVEVRRVPFPIGLCTAAQPSWRSSKLQPVKAVQTPVGLTFSWMRLYSSSFVAAEMPCHGRVPRRKYIRTYPIDTRSSRRLSSIPKRHMVS